MTRGLLALGVLFLGACGGALGSSPPDARAAQVDGAVDATAEAATDGPPAPDALGCGSQTCADDQICVVEYCGGGPVRCNAPGDGGSCADGWTYQPTGCPGGPAGCFPPPCVSPPPRCAARPAACGTELSCACIPSDTCDGIHCSSTSDRTVTCANA